MLRRDGRPPRVDVEAAETVQRFLAGRYLEITYAGRNGICQALTTLASSCRRPLVFHCRAGKDRTGVLVAILLSLLG
ncbi:MAG: tyrosine-protein phosphatase, partial [Nocardioides sp.]